MNAVVEMPRQGLTPDTGRMAVADVLSHAVAVQQVMKAVMKDGVHYGKIPGTDKPTLYQAGADVLAMTFRIAPQFATEDISRPGFIRYRVTARGIHQPTGIVLGDGIGECSTDEEKYRWRKSICDEEFDSTPQDMRRVKFGRGTGGSIYKTKQIRTEPADLANTVLKMAGKRAKIAMILNVTGAADMFGQDLEDLDETLRESLTEHDSGNAVEALRAECAEQVLNAKSEAELQAVVKACVPRFQAAKDGEGYGQFRAAVQARGAEIKAKGGTPAAAAPAPAPAPAPAASPAPDAAPDAAPADSKANEPAAAPPPANQKADDDGFLRDYAAAERAADAEARGTDDGEAR